MWSIDVYGGVSLSGVFFFLTFTKLSFFVFLLRFCYVAALVFSSLWQFYMSMSAALSIFLGSVGGLIQRKLKTLLAYSSVSHVGYTNLTFCAISLLGAQAAVFYLFVFMLSSVCVWQALLFLQVKVEKNIKYSKELGDLVSLFSVNSVLSFLIAVTALSFAGLPPFAGFLSKLMCFLAMVQEKLYLISAAAVLSSVVATFYYIRIVKTTSFENTLTSVVHYPIKTNKVSLLSFLGFFLVIIHTVPNLIGLAGRKTVTETYLQASTFV